MTLKKHIENIVLEEIDKVIADTGNEKLAKRIARKVEKVIAGRVSRHIESLSYLNFHETMDAIINGEK